jgi:LysR family glycine cleavage system transcriptional activator
MMRRLPSLSGIESFVAVMRAGSLKQAADELALSAPALSRRIQAFERFVGRPLFARGHQSLKPNADAERLMQAVAPLVDRLADAIEQIANNDDTLLRLRLGVLPLFAAQRLIPRLAKLRALHPELHLDIDTAPHAAQRLGEALDAAIILAREPDPALFAKRLDRNFVHAIAGPRYLGGSERVTEPADLRRVTVIIHRDLPDTFDTWRVAIGRPDLEPAAIDLYDSGQLILDAAAQGLGVAFMLASHLDDAHDPRLGRLFDERVASPYSYWFICRPRAMETAAVRLFHDWLVAEMNAQAQDAAQALSGST